MAIGSQPTVLDRLKERLVVALGKSQDKRVKHAQSKSYFCRDQQKIFQVQCGLGRIEDQLLPPCSPARRPRSASICRYFNFIFQRILLHWWFIFHIGVSFFFFPQRLSARHQTDCSREPRPGKNQNHRCRRR